MAVRLSYGAPSPSRIRSLVVRHRHTGQRSRTFSLVVRWLARSRPRERQSLAAQVLSTSDKRARARETSKSVLHRSPHSGGPPLTCDHQGNDRSSTIGSHDPHVNVLIYSFNSDRRKP